MDELELKQALELKTKIDRLALAHTLASGGDSLSPDDEIDIRNLTDAERRHAFVLVQGYINGELQIAKDAFAAL
jgi:hypothetical protein